MRDGKIYQYDILPFPPAGDGIASGPSVEHSLRHGKDSSKLSIGESCWNRRKRWAMARLPQQKRGLEVGFTKKGKGTKLMLLTDARGTPLSGFTVSAQVAKVNTLETKVDILVVKTRPDRLIYDKVADADWLRVSLLRRGVEQVTPHRAGRKKPSLQDGPSLRRYRHRSIIERTIRWLGA